MGSKKLAARREAAAKKKPAPLVIDTATTIDHAPAPATDGRIPAALVTPTHETPRTPAKAKLDLFLSILHYAKSRLLIM